MYCPECGTEIQDSSKGCEKCGAKVMKPRKGVAKWGAYILVVVVIAAVLYFFVSILLSNNPALSAPEPSMHLIGGQIHIDELSGKQGLSTATIKFNVYNTGNGPVKNVYAQIDLSSDGFKTMLASKKLFVGTINPGESRPITTEIPLSYTNSQWEVQVIPVY